MRTIFILILSILISSCNSNQKKSLFPESSDSLIVYDKSFYDFIYDFMTDKDFQLSRTKINNWEYNNFFSEYDYTLHFFKSFKIPEDEFEKDFTNTKYLTIIDIKKAKTTVLLFRKVDNNWILNKKSDMDFKPDSSVDFTSFLYNFSTDTTYLKEHIKFPLKYKFADPDKDFADSTLFINESNVTKYNFFDKGKLLFYHDSDFDKGNKILIKLNGIDNGLNSYYYFEKIDNQWFLIEENDYST